MVTNTHGRTNSIIQRVGNKRCIILSQSQTIVGKTIGHYLIQTQISSSKDLWNLPSPEKSLKLLLWPDCGLTVAYRTGKLQAAVHVCRLLNFYLCHKRLSRLLVPKKKTKFYFHNSTRPHNKICTTYTPHKYKVYGVLRVGWLNEFWGKRNGGDFEQRPYSPLAPELFSAWNRRRILLMTAHPKHTLFHVVQDLRESRPGS